MKKKKIPSFQGPTTIWHCCISLILKVKKSMHPSVQCTVGKSLFVSVEEIYEMDPKVNFF